MKIDTRTPIPFEDEDGMSCLRVPVNDHGTICAIIYKDDYDLVTQEHGITPIWSYQQNGGKRRYVVFTTPQVRDEPSGSMVVARLILDARRGQRVFYLNNSTLDLRRPNLELREVGGRSDHDAVDRVLLAHQKRAQAVSGGATLH